ncbi:catechol 2,3-dioxygenase-like lactoylglutathione lyase family enzyme [Mumia flava]|uniref:Catechol 2,3-dioxygenase-like lactoylglutathione lyase family enzyme n=1 Tax=Mumia flava TaxID=1348852 RepID=A0A2M9B8E8_9ACTN|nr:VOC family protein [Mumia flava]PJJ54226.1 catechol 2,3-dioxygenase-like lactoylglutathione lyase family enzyme [Mumia flava]
MAAFSGVNHVAFSVRDLEVSTRFYADVLGFLPLLDFGYGRVCMDRESGFTIALIRHPNGSSDRFSELTTGLDHLGLAAADRAELDEWVERFDAAGVEYTPIQEQPLGWHLNFRDPDGIALEFHAPSPMYAAALADLRSRDVPDSEIREVAEGMLGSEVVARP